MNTKWDYAYHVKMVHQAGGPEAFMKRTRQSSFNSGYLIGRSEGLQTGIFWMLPFAAGTGYLLYEKAPGIWKCIKDKVGVVQKQAEETVGPEKQEPKKKVNILCPNCREKVVSVTEIPEWHYFEKFRNKATMRQATCPQCGEKVHY